MLTTFRLAERNKEPEVMDQPGLPVEEHYSALRGLSRINYWSLSDWILWGPIAKIARENGHAPLRVLDIASGGGDVPLRLAKRARKRGWNVEFVGADLSPTALDYARDQAARAGVPIEYFRLDALAQDLPRGFDVITCSLFLHHLEMADAVSLMRRMAEATRSMVLINDLIRSPMGYAIAWVGTKTLSRSPVVHVDGLRSVRAAFTMQEASSLAHAAGLTDATIRWRWPFRFLLEWRRRP